MKYLLAAIALAFTLGAHAEAETKKVCHLDEKTKKEVCKTIKVHKKAEKVTTGNPTDPEPKKKK
jgi:hypothetical protein